MKPYTGFRFARVGKAAFWKCDSESLVLVPIKIPKGAVPQAEGEPLEVGSTRLITRGVEITPPVEFLWMR